jgi:phage recombination protein Bet
MDNQNLTPAMVSAFGVNMPAEYEQATIDVINELGVNVSAPVMFEYAYKMISNYGAQNVTKEDIFTFLIQCKNLGLNPLLKQIYGFVSRGKLAIVVSIEGWNAIANRSPQFDGCSFEFGPFTTRELSYNKITYNRGTKTTNNVTVKRSVADWVKCIVYRKDRTHPIVITTFFDEAYTGSEPWATMPMTMLQNRAFVNSVRKAFNVSAYSEDDRFINFDTPAAEPLNANAVEITEPAEPVSVPAPAPELPENNSILGQILPDASAPDMDIPELKPKRGRKKKTETAQVADTVETAETTSNAVDDLPLPPLPDNLQPAEPVSVPAAPAVPAVSSMAIDLAQTLNNAKDLALLQQLGYMISGMTQIDEADKNYLREIYQNNVKRLKK